MLENFRSYAVIELMSDLQSVLKLISNKHDKYRRTEKWKQTPKYFNLKKVIREKGRNFLTLVFYLAAWVREKCYAVLQEKHLNCIL